MVQFKTQQQIVVMACQLTYLIFACNRVLVAEDEMDLMESQHISQKIRRSQHRICIDVLYCCFGQRNHKDQ